MFDLSWLALILRQGIGVVITLGGLIMNNSVVKEIYLGGRAKLLLATIGQNAGTRYAVGNAITTL